MRAAVWLPLFDELADPLAVARLAATASNTSDAGASWHPLIAAPGALGSSRHTCGPSNREMPATT